MSTHARSPSLADHAKLPWIVRLRPITRLVAGIFAGVLAFFLQPDDILLQTRIVAAWDAGSLVYLLMAWIVISITDAHMTCVKTRVQDQSSYLIFLFVVVASLASLGAIGSMLGSADDLSLWPRVAHIALSAVALFSSWFLIHTLFAFHYARRYYAPDDNEKQRVGGLEFACDQEPDFLDFTYFSFVIGMTSQVSDVPVSSRTMRRLALVHSILSFVFNMLVLAMSINIIAGSLG